MPKIIFDDTAEENSLTINEAYAKKYEEKKRGEELSKLQEKYGKDATLEDFEDEDSEEDVEEDEFGELVTPEIDAQILKTIAAIRTKNPKIYENNTAFFSDEAVENARKKWKEKQTTAEKPVRLKDYHRKVLLEDGGIIEEEDGNAMTHTEEQEAIRKEVTAAFHASTGDGDEEDMEEEGDNFFQKRVKSKEELEEEEEAYRQFLLENMTEDNGMEAFQEWRNYQNNSQIDEDEKFLMDYILNRGWIDKSAKRVPSYQEIVGEHHDTEDEEQLEEADRFESQYNFRFEEQGATEIMTYSRNVEGSVRRKDDKRKQKREALKQRKEEEKLQKKEELKRLKNLKKKEIFEKLKQIQEITGNTSVGLDEVDLEGEFDPDKYDEKMSKMFDDDYYEQEDKNAKPTWDDDIDISDIVGNEVESSAKVAPNVQSEVEETAAPEDGKKKKKKKKKEKEKQPDEDGDFIMDADYLPGGDAYDEGTTQGHEATSSKAGDKISKKDFEKYLEEYHQLDYEDMVGDQPTRFKYRQVKPASYGLTPVEILLADDQELNEFVSLKKIAPYRPPEKEEHDLRKYSKKKRLRMFRMKLQQQHREEMEAIPNKKWRLPSSKSTSTKGVKRSREESQDISDNGAEKQTDTTQESGKKKKKKKAKKSDE
ncbi:uncharacterized protein VTP21DRAFT_5685 [Calcarisporiella thermophila]|uniref:uncharacterized protein n=1 Tax=Calcarisporiella thermophila TaxID=911321 RepID=UPI0037423B90